MYYYPHGYFLYFCEGCKPVFSEAVMLSPIGASTAELAFRGRWELARERAIKDKYAQGRVGQNDCAFSIYNSKITGNV